MTTRKKPEPDGLIGMFGHTFEDGEIQYQFQVVRRSEDVYICQLFSWIDGDPTDCITISRSRLLDLVLYQTAEDMNRAFEKRRPRHG